PPPDGEPSPSRRWPLLIASGGVAALALGLGVVEHLSWQRDVDSFGSMPACGADIAGRGGASCSALYDSGNRARTLAFIGYGVAGALAVTTVVLAVKSAPRR